MTAPAINLDERPDLRREELPGVSRATAIDLVTGMQRLYADAETRLAADIARMLAAGMGSPTWATDKLEQTARLRAHTERVLARLAQDTSREVTYAIASAYMRGGQEASRALLQLGMDLPANPDDQLRKLLDGPRSQLVAGLTELGRAFPGIAGMMRVSASLALRITGTHLPVLRWAEDAYRKVIAAGALTDVLGGIATRRRASQVAWEGLLSEGITGFTDKAGRNWNLATYVEMATRTGVAQAAVEGHLDRLDEGGLDLVMVSNAPQECERCRKWEGKILARKGTPGKRKIQTENVLTGRMNTIEIAGTVDEAVADGLLHPNCRHRFVAYLHGATKVPVDTADPEGDAARQRLRELERGVRREKLKAQAAIDPEAGKAHQAKVRKLQAKIREHVDANEHLGIFRKPEREQINLGNGPTPTAPPRPKPVPPAPTPPRPAKPKPASTKPATKPAAPPKPKVAKDDYTERRKTKREEEIAEQEKILKTVERNRRGALASWDNPARPPAEREAGKKRANEYYDDQIKEANRRIASLRNSADPALDQLTDNLARTGTPSVARAQAHVRSVMKVPGDAPPAHRANMEAELDRQASLATRTAMTLRGVNMPRPGSAAAVDFASDQGPHTLAFYRWAGLGRLREMTFGPKWISHQADMESACRHAQRSGWWTPSGSGNSLATTLAHEYGHHVTNCIFDINANHFDPDRSRRLLTVIGDALKVPVSLDADVLRELTRVCRDHKMLIVREVSEYGSTNAAELLAEIWQEWSTMGERARPHIRAIGRVMQKLAEEGAFE